MTVQHSGYRHTSASGPAQTPLFDPQSVINHSRAFHRELRNLRSALWADDRRRIAQSERALNQIVASWERESESAASQ